MEIDWLVGTRPTNNKPRCKSNKWDDCPASGPIDLAVIVTLQAKQSSAMPIVLIKMPCWARTSIAYSTLTTPFKIKFEMNLTIYTWHWENNRTMVVTRQTYLSRWKHHVVPRLG